MTKITITAAINADATQVWDCYTQPEHITQWNFADPSWHCPSASNDLRIGGKYIARMEARDQSMGFDFEAVYNDVNPGKSFTYTMPDDRVVNARFDEGCDNTTVTIVFAAEGQNPEEMQRQGWQAILNNFKAYVEGLG